MIDGKLQAMEWDPAWDAKLADLRASGVPLNAALGQELSGDGGDGAGAGDGGQGDGTQGDGGQQGGQGAGGDQGAAGDQGAGAGDGGQQQGGQQPPDAAALMDAFTGFRDDVLTRFDGLEERVPAPAAAGQGDGEQEPEDYFAPNRFSVQDFDDEGNLTPQAQQRALREMMQDVVTEALTPFTQSQQRDRINREATALEQKYPDLQDPQKRAQAIQTARVRAQRMAQASGNSALAEAWREPAFLELSMLAAAGSQAAGSQAPAGQQGGVVLEQGGSAGPAGSGGQQQDETASRIVQTAQRTHFRLGSPGG